MRELYFPLESREIFRDLKAGAEVLLSGTVYTARDQAHLRLLKMIKEENRLPDFLSESLIFYAGPSFFKDGTLSAIGPTTAARMDDFAPLFYEYGVAATLGKGPRKKTVVDACKKNRSVYLVTFGGAAAYLTKFVKKIEPVLFTDLGPEAVFKVEIEKLPAVVGFDSSGGFIEKLVKL